MSYHNGSVWPHDTSLCAAGMARYGERAAVAELIAEVYAAATHFQLRLPELFCGFARQTGEPPIAYPVACLPQAWAAGSVFLMLQAALGVSIDALEGRIDIDDPVLPPGIDRLNVSNLQVGTARLDLAFRRLDDQTVVTPLNRVGQIRVQSVR
jgi:glycogen debranching enzyme